MATNPGQCDMEKLIDGLVATFIGTIKKFNTDINFDEIHEKVKLPLGDNTPTSLIKAMVPVLNERLAGREVTYEGFSGTVYVRIKARIKAVTYADLATTGKDMRGFIFVLESLEDEPRVFEVHMPIKGEASIIDIVNSALLIHNNRWIADEIEKAVKEASDALAKEADADVRAYAVLKLLGVVE